MTKRLYIIYSNIYLSRRKTMNEDIKRKVEEILNATVNLVELPLKYGRKLRRRL